MKFTGIIIIGGVLITSWQASAGEWKLKSLQVKNPLQAGVPYRVTLPYSKTGKVKPIEACFLWSGEGPYCFKMKVLKKSIRVRLRTGNPNTYKLTGFIRYRSDGKVKETNDVSARIDVR